MLPPTAALVAAFGAVGASCTGIRQYGFLTHFEVNTSEARRRVRQMYNDFGILDFQFYDAFYNYSRPMLGDSWVSKPSACFTAMPRLVRKETVKAYTDEIRKLPGGHARSWLYVQAVAADEPMDTMTALQHVLKKALVHGGLKRGLREVAKALDSRTAKLCCLAKDCDNAEYSRLVRALCDEGGVNLIMVDEGRQLGEWAGLCKIDKDGLPRKVVGASCVAVTDFGEEGQAYEYMMNYLGKSA